MDGAEDVELFDQGFVVIGAEEDGRAPAVLGQDERPMLFSHLVNEGRDVGPKSGERLDVLGRLDTNHGLVCAGERTEKCTLLWRAATPPWIRLGPTDSISAARPARSQTTDL